MMPTKKRRTEWADLIAQQGSSGQGVKAWCKANGINVNTMYNEIGKSHKLASVIGNKQAKKAKRLGNAVNTEKIEKSETVTWKEVKAFPGCGDYGQSGSVYIEIGGIRVAADGGYPAANLAALCKELIRP